SSRPPPAGAIPLARAADRVSSFPLRTRPPWRAVRAFARCPMMFHPPGNAGLRALAALGLWLLLCIPALACAESLASVEGTALPALPAGAQVRSLVSVEDRPLALGDGHGWLLDASERQWAPVELPALAGARVLDAAQHAGRSWLPRAQAGALRIRALVWRHGAVRHASLGVPAQLAGEARMAVLDGRLYLAGREEGAAGLWSRAIDGTDAAWREHGGWPGAAAPAALGAQKFALYLDRKSTRLNSSHVKISYAVFCLK